MTIDDRTDPAQTGTLTFTFELAHPPEKVWRALTEPELLAAWLLPSIGFDLAPGTSFSFHTAPVGGWDGTVACRLLEAVPLERLRLAWVVGELDTVVTFTLARTDAGTRLSLVHEGFTPAQKQNFGGARYGWKLMGGKLVALLAEAP